MAHSRKDKRNKTIIVFIVCCTLALLFLRWKWRKDDPDEVAPLSKKSWNVPHSEENEGRKNRRHPLPDMHNMAQGLASDTLERSGPHFRSVEDEEEDIKRTLNANAEDPLNLEMNREEPDELLYIWPPPRKVSESTKKMVAIDPDFSVKVSSSSAVLARGIKRYEAIIKNKTSSPLTSMGCAKPGIRHVVIELESDGENLDLDTSYQYSLMISVNMGVTIHAASPYGALYGLETFSQLVRSGCLQYSELQVEDYPRFRHRGLLLDTGRRVVPKKLIFNILDAMSFLKLNVFHWHLTDYCIFSIESKQFPELTAGLSSGQFYTSGDVQEIVEYARLLGIRVIPEIDVPGHAGGLKALNTRGLHFCDGTFKQIHNDPKGQSILTLKKLIREVSAMFPDKYFHLGCDETSTRGSCSIESTKQLEVELSKYLLSLSKIPVAWEEAHTVTKVTEAVKDIVIQNWSRSKATDIARSKVLSIESSYHNFYFDLSYAKLTDAWNGKIGFQGDEAYMNQYILGGEFAMWTDEWCPTKQCWGGDAQRPVAHWMHEQKYDDVFMQSLSGLLWPRGIAAAGNFWNFVPEMHTEEMQKRVKHQLAVMLTRGVMACPVDCDCEYLQRCGVRYKME